MLKEKPSFLQYWLGRHESTVGVHQLTLPGEKIKGKDNVTVVLKIFDFGGQEEYYVAHPFLLPDSEMSVSIFMWNMNLAFENLRNALLRDSRIADWLASLLSGGGEELCLVLIGTHYDQVKKENLMDIAEVFHSVVFETITE